jgi:hypothetical protein
MTPLLFITGALLLNAFIWIIVAALIYFLLIWAIKAIPVPEPFATVCRAIVIIAAIVFLINGILSLVGYNFIK